MVRPIDRSIDWLIDCVLLCAWSIDSLIHCTIHPVFDSRYFKPWCFFSDCVAVDSEEDVLNSSPPQSNRSSHHRRKRQPEIELLNDDSIEIIPTTKKFPKKKSPITKKKGRQSKAEKALQAVKNKSAAASKAARDRLLASLDSSSDDSVEEMNSSPPSQSSSMSTAESTKELFIVLWGKEKYKFRLTRTEKFHVVFEEMARVMATEPSKVFPASPLTNWLMYLRSIDCLA